MTAKQPRVVCVGDIALDEIISVRRLPAPGGKADGTLIGRFPGGMATNAAVAFCRLGVPARLVAAAGEDSAGAMICGVLKDCGVDIGPVVVLPQTATFRCIVMIDGDGEKALVRLPSPAYLPAPDHITSDALEGADHIHTTLGDPALTAAAMSRAGDAGRSTSLDVERPDVEAAGPSLAALVARASMVFANEAAMEAMETALGSQALAAIPELVVTRGPAGAHVRHQGATLSVPGRQVAVVDSTGAGDCFAAAYVAQRLRGHGPAAAGGFAATAAALSVTTFGAQTSMPTHDAVTAAMDAEAAAHTRDGAPPVPIHKPTAP